MQYKFNQHVVYGILLTFLMHSIALILVLAPSLIINANVLWSFYPLLFIGLFQLIYVLPVIVWFKQKQYFDLMFGVMIGAEITFFLNGGCWLMLGIG